MSLPDIGPQIRAGLQKLIETHAYPIAFQATLGDGLGHVVVPNPDVPGLVYFRGDTQDNAGDIGQAVQAEWLPVADSIGGVSFDGLPVMIGKKPAIHGGKDRLYVIANNTTLGALEAAGGSQIIYQIINQTGMFYLQVQVNEVAQTPRYALDLAAGPGMTITPTDDGTNNRTIATFTANASNILTDANGNVLSDANGNVLTI